MKRRTKPSVSCVVVARTANGQLSEKTISIVLASLSAWLRGADADVTISSENLRGGRIGFRVVVGAKHVKTKP